MLVIDTTTNKKYNIPNDVFTIQLTHLLTDDDKWEALDVTNKDTIWLEHNITKVIKLSDYIIKIHLIINYEKVVRIYKGMLVV